MAKERIERKRRTRKMAILDSAADVLAREGYPGLSMEKVAAELDLTKAALYHYFSGKDVLVTSVIEHLGKESLERLEFESATETTGVERLRKLISTHLIIVAFDSPSAGQLFARADVWDAPHRAEINKFRKSHQDMFRVTVEQGIEEGSLHPLSVDVSLQCLMAALASANHWRALANSSRTIDKRVSLVTDTLLTLFGVPMPGEVLSGTK